MRRKKKANRGDKHIKSYIIYVLYTDVEIKNNY